MSETSETDAPQPAASETSTQPAKKGGNGKTLRSVAIVALLCIAVLVVVVMRSIDSIARVAVEQGGTTALGVKTSLDKADVNVFGGTFTMNGLNVANPEGFPGPHFLALGSGGVEADLGSLRSDVIRLPWLELDALDVHLDRSSDGANYQVILDNIGGEESKPEDPDAEGAKYVIDRLTITNVTVHAALVPGLQSKKQTFSINRIELTNLGAGGAKPMELVDVIGAVTKAVLAASSQAIGDVAGELAAQLDAQLGSLQSLDALGIDAAAVLDGKLANIAGDLPEDLLNRLESAGEISEALGGAAGEAQEAIEGAGEKARDALDDVKKLIPGGG